MSRHYESRLQKSCVKWFDMQYPKLRLSLFAIGNGGLRKWPEAAIMFGEGVRAGVSDLFLAMAKGGYHGFFIEMKFGQGKLTESQKLFQAEMQRNGYKTAVCNDIDLFKYMVDNYLNS